MNHHAHYFSLSLFLPLKTGIYANKIIKAYEMLSYPTDNSECASILHPDNGIISKSQHFNDNKKKIWAIFLCKSACIVFVNNGDNVFGSGHYARLGGFSVKSEPLPLFTILLKYWCQQILDAIDQMWNECGLVRLAQKIGSLNSCRWLIW